MNLEIQYIKQYNNFLCIVFEYDCSIATYR